MLPGIGGTEIDGGTEDPAIAWKLIDRLKQRLEQLPELPGWRGKPAAQNDGLLWWFLRDRRLDVGESVSKLEQCLRWRREFRVDYIGPEHFMGEMRSKKAYFHKHRDLAGRPVLVVVAQRHNLFERRLDESCSMCAWFLEQTMDKLATLDPPARPNEVGSRRAPGTSGAQPVEQALGIFDLRGFSPMQADMEFATFLVQAIHSYYPGRFGRILLVDAPDIFRSFWQNVRPLLHRYASLADFVSAQEVCDKYFAPGEAPSELQ